MVPRQMRGSFSQKGPQGSGMTVTFLGSPLPPQLAPVQWVCTVDLEIAWCYQLPAHTFKAEQ